MKKTYVILLILLTSSCNDDFEQMDNWEQEISSMLNADYIELIHTNKSTSINGGQPTTENYLQLDIHNSKVLEKIDFNERVLGLKCDEIKDSILVNPMLQNFPEFNELRIRLIKKKSFLIFKSENENIITYKIK